MGLPTHEQADNNRDPSSPSSAINISFIDSTILARGEGRTFQLNILKDRHINNHYHQHIGNISPQQLYDWIKQSLHELDGKNRVVTNAQLRIFVAKHSLNERYNDQAPAMTDALIELLAQAWYQQVENMYARDRNCHFFIESGKDAETYYFCNIATQMWVRVPQLGINLRVTIDFGKHGGKNTDGWFDCEGVMGATQGVLWGMQEQPAAAFETELFHIWL
ncbi:hypothetical protein K458DRAFT_427439 [Lentithecium fluviatile CBS 122367]|uniref:Uncharacterized protein n=1 Tax=Lentithecium fluviatile CBS 122367 TaxID=1168545 RepID=A0A6G1JF85_9PLEO|nr:hypothetical protein K458DRAFT_427439 [Lentithecium fluviatile CBS 122367]